jgi:hypothetical protein
VVAREQNAIIMRVFVGICNPYGAAVVVAFVHLTGDKSKGKVSKANDLHADVDDKEG